MRKRAIVREDVPLSGGEVLRAGKHVMIWMTKENYSGIEWLDDEGVKHSMAISTDKLVEHGKAYPSSVTADSDWPWATENELAETQWHDVEAPWDIWEYSYDPEYDREDYFRRTGEWQE